MKNKFFVIIFICFFLLIQNTSVYGKINVSNDNIEILSKHCICIERTTEQILFEKNAYTKCPMASTTKILTGIIVIENCDLTENVTISKKAANTGGSTLGISEGQIISVENLLYGLLLRSGNDTAVALAEHISGSVELFSQKMNIKAKEIGLKNSNFTTPHGLDNEEHYTTAYDLAILTNYALKNETFLKIVGTKQISINIGNVNRILNNTNELLENVDGVYGVKTGFTGNAGRCLVTACKRENIDIIIVILGADTKNIRGSDTKKVINYVFENYKMLDTKKEIEDFFSYYKNNAKIQSVKSLSKIAINYKKRNNYFCPIDKKTISKLKISIYCFNKLEAPIRKGTIIGKMRLMCDNKILYEIDVFLDKKIDRINWSDYFDIFVKKYITFYSI